MEEQKKPTLCGPPPRAWGTRHHRIGGLSSFRSTPTRVGNTIPCPGPAGRTTVHPHARGEHMFRGVHIPTPHGPPPRAWGTQHTCSGIAGQSRSTPTRVGNTTVTSATSNPSTVHPHARGEHSSSVTYIRPNSGPPPRAWGTRLAPHRRSAPSGPPPRAWGTRLPRDDIGLDARSTPTRVGNTADHAAGHPRWAVHPHARGEHGVLQPELAAIAGPPPRAWGTQRLETYNIQRCRSTPTRVGNTAGPARRPASSAVHPHARGEHATKIDKDLAGDGPPPRAWGTRHSDPAVAGYRRSTPTRVGNTRKSPTLAAVSTVHPHARGEHYCVAVRKQYQHGPPPRAWGTRGLGAEAPDVLRSTPTRVGNTVSSATRSTAKAVHPHARGEHATALPSPLARPGPPPRAWGTR